MKKGLFLGLLSFAVLVGRAGVRQTDGKALGVDVDRTRISVMGSSVANGEGAEEHRGYAYLYNELMERRFKEGRSHTHWHLSGISVNGNNTLNLLERYDDLLRDSSAYVIFGLSLGNEGIHGAKNRQQIFDRFKNNMLRLIAQARKDGKCPVVMNNYVRGDFDAEDYRYVRQMDLLIHEWDVPSVNVLGALDGGHGRWAEGFQNGTDVYHPSTGGHREFMYAMVPSLFDALAQGKGQPVRMDGTFTLLDHRRTLELVPEEVLHSFTLSFRIKTRHRGTVATVCFSDEEASQAVLVAEEEGLLYRSSSGGSITGTASLSDGCEHTVLLTHYYARGETLLYVDGQLMGQLSERIEAKRFVLGNAETDEARQYGNLFFWRSGMNADEVQALQQGAMLKSSLELYAPLDGTNIRNRAQSTNELRIRTN